MKARSNGSLYVTTTEIFSDKKVQATIEKLLNSKFIKNIKTKKRYG